MSDETKGAILQRDKSTYAIVPRIPMGLMSPEALEAILNVVKKYNIPVTKITSGQRMALVGIKKEDIEPIYNDLKMDVGHATELCMHFVQACPGTAVCKFGQQDSLGLGTELEKMYYDVELPAKVKIAISGCPMCCAESYVRDVGIVGKKDGWTVAFGGNAGGRARVADILAENLSKDETISLVEKALEYYRQNASKKERTAKFIDRTGIEAMREYLKK